MNQQQAKAISELAAQLTTQLAKMKSDPVITQYLKLESFAESVGLQIKAADHTFKIKNKKKVLFTCETTAELNNWFKENYLEEVL